MNKGELLELIKDYPNEIEIRVWDLLNGLRSLERVEAMVDIETKWGGTVGSPTKTLLETHYLKLW